MTLSSETWIWRFQSPVSDRSLQSTVRFFSTSRSLCYLFYHGLEMKHKSANDYSGLHWNFVRSKRIRFKIEFCIKWFTVCGLHRCVDLKIPVTGMWPMTGIYSSILLGIVQFVLCGPLSWFWNTLYSTNDCSDLYLIVNMDHYERVNPFSESSPSPSHVRVRVRVFLSAEIIYTFLWFNIQKANAKCFHRRRLYLNVSCWRGSLFL